MSHCFYERLLALVRASHKSMNQIEREIGLPRNALNNYKRGASPTADRLALLANYFEVSMEYLQGGKEGVYQLSMDQLYKVLSPTQKRKLYELSQEWMIKKENQDR